MCCVRFQYYGDYAYLVLKTFVSHIPTRALKKNKRRFSHGYWPPKHESEVSFSLSVKGFPENLRKKAYFCKINTQNGPYWGQIPEKLRVMEPN